MSYADLRLATTHALYDERLRQAELSRRTRRLRNEARARRRENQVSYQPRRA
ncbi:hypothetical protein NE857_23820 [Nocardiopsis exhalans]|uniref:Uncharacterized protein n=1 Tax=Nocardiopsis exhalans TaxID=163604 RepID=A0ABY5D3J5_9ACTN|nr:MULTISPECIES: hypothetical protein [Nocardiopsis]USY18321.1 hypothetical protein NE857_23820 [Nocardiopsis exhalans]